MPVYGEAIYFVKYFISSSSRTGGKCAEPANVIKQTNKAPQNQTPNKQQQNQNKPYKNLAPDQRSV